MKDNIQLLGLLLVFTFGFISCEEEIDTSSTDAFIESVAKTWIIDESAYVFLDDQDITGALIGFEITVDQELNYTTNSHDLTMDIFPWPSSGSFTVNDELTQFTRNDGLIITTSLSESGQLTLDFTYAEGFDNSANGRTEGIHGSWSMSFKNK